VRFEITVKEYHIGRYRSFWRGAGIENLERAREHVLSQNSAIGAFVRLLYVAGPRPVFPKLAPVHHDDAPIGAKHTIVHAGQH